MIYESLSGSPAVLLCYCNIRSYKIRKVMKILDRRGKRDEDLYHA